MKNNFLRIAFLLGSLAVALGAFGAHALKQLLNEQQLQVYQTSVQYHFYHALALAITGLLQLHYRDKWLVNAGYGFIAGLIIFCGSLYSMSFLKAAGVTGVNWLGAITPLGGVCFIAGWVCLAVAAGRIKKQTEA
jgi:uncharacterized membrane protein YgdD (TMEM256/DUF423 family)